MNKTNNFTTAQKCDIMRRDHVERRLCNLEDVDHRRSECIIITIMTLVSACIYDVFFDVPFVDIFLILFVTSLVVYFILCKVYHIEPHNYKDRDETYRIWMKEMEDELLGK